MKKLGKLYFYNFFRKKCSLYKLHQDGRTLMKGNQIVLKRGEVRDIIEKFHLDTGHGGQQVMSVILT